MPTYNYYPAIDENQNFAPSVRKALAESSELSKVFNAGIASAVSKLSAANGPLITQAVQETLSDKADAASVTARRGSAVPEVDNGYLFVVDSMSGKRTRVTHGTDILNNIPTIMGEGVSVTINGAAKWVSPSGYPRTPVTDYTKASGWGSSTMQLLASGLSEMFLETGTTYHHIAGSVGGFQISHIAAAVGVRPLLAKEFTIPADLTPVPIVPTNMTEANNKDVKVAWTGSFKGYSVNGRIETYQGSDEWVFIRSGTGVPVKIPANTEFIPARAIEYQNGITILNPGKNTLTALKGEWTADRVCELTDKMFDFFSGAGRQVLVLGHFVDTDKPANSINRAPIKQYNDHMRGRFGGRFVDILEYITSPQVWVDTGITPTEDDLAQQLLGNKPPSLSRDTAHFNDVANAAITKLIKNKLASLGWVNIPIPPPMLTTIADNFNRDDGDLGFTSTGLQPWKNPPKSYIDMPYISNNMMVNTSSQIRRALVTPPSGSQRYEVSARIAGLGATPADKSMGIMVRANNVNDYIYFSVRSHSNGEGASFWYQSTAVSSLGPGNPNVKSAVGQVWKVRVDGNTLTGYVDDVEVVKLTDLNISSTGEVGLLLGGGTSSACAWDDFTVTKLDSNIAMPL